MEIENKRKIREFEKAKRLSRREKAKKRRRIKVDWRKNEKIINLKQKKINIRKYEENKRENGQPGGSKKSGKLKIS